MKYFSHLLLSLFLLLILLAVASLFIGSADIYFNDFFQPGTDAHFILTEFRMPRTVALIAIGASLALCGVLLQTLLGNPLAEPFTLGLSGASTLGSVLFLFFGFSPEWLSLPLGALLGSFAAMFLILSVQKVISTKSHILILTGVMVSFFAGALVTFIVSIMSPQQMQTALYWMMGQVGSPRDVWSYFLLPFFIIIFIYFYKRRIHLDRILLGDDTALNLGTRIKKEKFLLILFCSVLTAFCVSISGLVGFVGLVAPHLCYLLFKTRRHSLTLVAAPLLGAILFLSSDIISRWISPDSDIPAGSLMALIGAPILILFLLKGVSRAHSS